MSLAKKYSKEVKQILSKYPPEHKCSAGMPLLYLAQREAGYINKAAMQDVGSIVDITETEVAAIVGFYTLYHDKKAAKYRMQVCTDLPCASALMTSRSATSSSQSCLPMGTGFSMGMSL